MLHEISFDRQNKVFDESYLKNKYKMYVVDGKGRTTNASFDPESRVDFDKVVYQVLNRDNTSDKFHDTEIDWTTVYFCSDDPELVNFIKNLSTNYNNAVPTGDDVDDYFKPIFRDLAVHAGFKDPFQETYNRDFLRDVEHFVDGLDFLDKNSIPRKSERIERGGLSILYNELYSFKSTDGIALDIIVYFDPSSQNTVQLNPETMHKTGEQFVLNERLIDALRSDIIKKQNNSIEIENLIEELKSEFVFLDERGQIKDALGILIKSKDEILVYEHSHNFDPQDRFAEWETPNAIDKFEKYEEFLSDGYGSNTPQLQFNNVNDLKDLLRKKDIVNNLLSFASRVSAAEKKLSQRVDAFLDKLRSFQVEGFEDFLLIVKETTKEKGTQICDISVSCFGHEKWGRTESIYREDIAERDDRKLDATLKLLILDAVDEIETKISMYDDDSKMLNQMPASAIQSVIKFIENRDAYNQELSDAGWSNTGGDYKTRNWQVCKSKFLQRVNFLLGTHKNENM